LEEEKTAQRPGIIARIEKRLNEAAKRAIYTIIPEVPQLIPGITGANNVTRGIAKEDSKSDNGETAEHPTKYEWSGQELDGMSLQITPLSRVVFDFKDHEEGLQIRFFDSEGSEVHPIPTHPLDEYGIASYDFSDLPPGEYSLLIELPETK